jgi:hypothetical protein
VIGFFGGPGASQVSAQTAEAVQQQIDQLRRDFDALKQQYGDRRRRSKRGWRRFKERRAARQPHLRHQPRLRHKLRKCLRGPKARGPTGTLPIYGTTGAAVSGAKVFNPDMAVIGDFLGTMGRNQAHPDPTLELHESEASFQAVVDPCARRLLYLVWRGVLASRRAISPYVAAGWVLD